jgi:Na+(H+)/acetate symporter ActP
MLGYLRQARGAAYMELPALSHCLVRFYTEQAIRDARVLWNEAQLGPIA